MSEQLLREFRQRAEHLVPLPDLDELQRRGTRLRRARIAACAAVVASALAIGGVVVTSGIGRQDAIAPATGEGENLPAPEPPTGLPPDAPVFPTGLPPEGATPSTPASGQLVASVMSHTSSGPAFVYVYSDGRLIWQTLGQVAEPGWLEQRLTPEGVELVRAEILSTGLFDPDRPPPGSELGLAPESSGDIQVLNSDRLVYVPGRPGQAWMPEFDRLHRRLAELQSWLPTSAWEDRQIRAYVPSRYFVCVSNHPHGFAWKGPMEPASIVSLLPQPAGELLAEAQLWRAEALATRDLHTAAIDARKLNYFVDDVDSPPCFDVTTEEARALTATLDQYLLNGHLLHTVPPPAPGSSFNRPPLIGIWPSLPHGVPATDKNF